ncbi:MAG: beta-lactamase family protein [Planctomycetes bacterium]|nr:beta-lactamase family protein [Planctomycetota bacterium]
MTIASRPRFSSPRRTVPVLLPALLALLGTSAKPAAAQEAPDLREQLDKIAGAEVRADRSVGIVAKVGKGAETLLLGTYGRTDVDSGEAMTADTLVSIGPITKQFTAAAILQLRDRGKLTLDDDVTRWLPDFRTHGNKVTLRHLLGHTSGVADLAAMPELRKLRMLRNPDLTRDAIYGIVNTQPFQFPTGSMQVYSNTGYWLLGRVLEKASGMRYEDYVERELLAPLGMKHTCYGSDAEQSSRCAAGHGIRDGKARRLPRIVHNGTFAAGALHASVEDLTLWTTALHAGKVLSPRSYAEMIAPTRLADGTPTQYGMGIVLAEDRQGRPFLGHDGGGFGFSAVARWYGEAELAVVVLTNSEPDTLTTVADDLAGAVLPQPSARGAFQGDAQLLVGKFGGPGRTAGSRLLVEVTQGPAGLTISVDEGTAEPLRWVEGTTFRQDRSRIQFLGNGAKEPANELRLDTGGDHFVLGRQ